MPRVLARNHRASFLRECPQLSIPVQKFHSDFADSNRPFLFSRHELERRRRGVEERRRDIAQVLHREFAHGIRIRPNLARRVVRAVQNILLHGGNGRFHPGELCGSVLGNCRANHEQQSRIVRQYHRSHLHARCGLDKMVLLYYQATRSRRSRNEIGKMSRALPTDR